VDSVPETVHPRVAKEYFPQLAYDSVDRSGNRAPGHRAAMVSYPGSAGSSVLLSNGSVGASYGVSIYPGDPLFLASYRCRSDSLHLVWVRTGCEAGFLEDRR
jgi:hypothetical protein